MLKPTIYTLIVVVCIFAMSGCPPESSGTPAGVWRLDFDDLCEHLNFYYHGLVLNSDGTATHYATFLYDGNYFQGTWTLSGDTLRIYTTTPANQSLVFIGTFQKNKIVSGRLTVDGVGRSDCWTAERVVF